MRISDWSSDVCSSDLIEGFRPGVAERLGVGPDVCLERNPRLIYGRITGHGQDGTLAQRAGHDLNYTALAGVIDLIGPADGPPVMPLKIGRASGRERVCQYV